MHACRSTLEDPTAAATGLWLGPLVGGLPNLGARAAAGPLAGLGLSTLPWAALLALLQSTTHHRPLGAVVFAILAAALVACAGLVAWRALDLAAASERSPRVARAAAWMLGGAAAFGPVVLTAGLLRSGAGRVAAFDVALVVGLSALLLRVPRPAAWQRTIHRISIPLWLLVTVGGVLVAHGSGANAAERASPALFAPLGWLAP